MHEWLIKHCSAKIAHANTQSLQIFQSKLELQLLALSALKITVITVITSVNSLTTTKWIVWLTESAFWELHIVTWILWTADCKQNVHCGRVRNKGSKCGELVIWSQSFLHCVSFLLCVSFLHSSMPFKKGFTFSVQQQAAQYQHQKWSNTIQLPSF